MAGDSRREGEVTVNRHIFFPREHLHSSHGIVLSIPGDFTGALQHTSVSLLPDHPPYLSELAKEFLSFGCVWKEGATHFINLEQTGYFLLLKYEGPVLMAVSCLE